MKKYTATICDGGVRTEETVWAATIEAACDAIEGDIRNEEDVTAGNPDCEPRTEWTCHITGDRADCSLRAAGQQDAAAWLKVTLQPRCTITSNDHGREVELEYSADIADQVRAIEAFGAENEDGVIQAQEAVKLFPGQPALHTTMTEYTALVAAGCVVVEAEAGEHYARPDTMMVDGQPISAHKLLREIGERKFGLLDYNAKHGSCRIRLWGESDDVAMWVNGANARQLELLAAAADWVRQ